MLYAFFLFWPANVLPLYLLIALLQIYIPLNILIRQVFMGSEQKTIHKLASAIIVLAVGLNSFVLLKNFDKWGVYYMLFLGSAAFDIMSHGLKEAVVRSVPIDQGKFNLRISIAQLVSGLILAPILLSISYKYENYQPGSKLAEYQLTGSDFMKFFGEYFSMGLQCAFNFSDNPEFVYDSDEKDVCKFTLLPMIFYVLSIFGLQLTIQTLMVNKSIVNARMIFA